jgi:hypothetical protein
MQIYHSFWDGGYSTMNETLHDLHELSVLTSLQNFGNIHLITTERGKEFLQDLPYTSIQLFDSEIDSRYGSFWSVGKIFAIEQILKKRQPFLHIDYDVFFFKPLVSEVLNTDVLIQDIEGKESVLGYGTEKFYEVCKDLKFFKDGLVNMETNGINLSNNLRVDFAYNCGILGGNDIDFFSNYVTQIKDFIESPINYDVFESHDGLDHISCILEQFSLAIMCKNSNIKVRPLLGTNYDLEERDRIAHNIGYTHLMGEKRSQETLLKVKQKIQKLKSK